MAAQRALAYSSFIRKSGDASNCMNVDMLCGQECDVLHHHSTVHYGPSAHALRAGQNSKNKNAVLGAIHNALSCLNYPDVHARHHEPLVLCMCMVFILPGHLPVQNYFKFVNKVGKLQAFYTRTPIGLKQRLFRWQSLLKPPHL